MERQKHQSAHGILPDLSLHICYFNLEWVCLIKLIPAFNMFQHSDHEFDFCWRNIEHRGRWQCAVADTHAWWSWQRRCHSYHPVIEQDWGCRESVEIFSFPARGQGMLLAPDPNPRVLESKWEDNAYILIHSPWGTRHFVVWSYFSYFGKL